MSSVQTAPVHDTEETLRQIDALGPWFHNLHLPGGVQTMPNHFLGGDFPGFKWREIERTSRPT
jgi:tRNA (mo5U34)-methyltransferase